MVRILSSSTGPFTFFIQSCRSVPVYLTPSESGPRVSLRSCSPRITRHPPKEKLLLLRHDRSRSLLSSIALAETSQLPYLSPSIDPPPAIPFLQQATPGGCKKELPTTDSPTFSPLKKTTPTVSCLSDFPSSHDENPLETR